MATYKVLPGGARVLVSLGSLTRDELRALKSRGGLPAAPAEAAPPEPCVHLGQATGDVADCPSCGGRVRLKVMACAVYGRCTPTRQVDGLACCLTCPDYRARGS